MLVDWNNTDKSFPGFRLHELFEAQADGIRIIQRWFFAAASCLTPNSMPDRTKLAHYLRQNGAANGSLVGSIHGAVVRNGGGAGRDIEIRRGLRPL